MEEFEGGLEKRKGKGEKRRKKEKSDKTHVEIPLWSLNTAKKSTKQGRILEGGGGRIFLAGQNINPCIFCREGLPIFTYSRDIGEYWGALLEKACAKYDENVLCLRWKDDLMV